MGETDEINMCTCL